LKKNKISKNWIKKQKKDIFVRKSKLEGYRSRAVYKLIEINEKFNLIKNGASILDLGGAPGSWSQYILNNYKNIRLLTIDLKEIESINKAYQLKADFTEIETKNKIKGYFGGKIDILLSDMAENTTGNKNLDVISTTELFKEAIYFSKEILKKKGSFISKIFMGSTFKEIMTLSKEIYEETRVFKPISSRKDSKENFIICRFLR
tara:strand:- start:1825 stop:2436 length:612 start_codon:yes stop_codon:yes gene_type:complete